MTLRVRLEPYVGGDVAGDGAGDRPTPPRYVVRVGTEAEAGIAARLHAEQITTGFLSQLGPRFLERLYRRVVLWEGGLLLVAVDTATGRPGDDGVVVGFIASADPTSGLYRQFLLHDAVGAVLGTIGPLLRTWRKVLETLRHGSSSSPGVGRGPEVLAMAVDSGSQGKGLGRSLVLGFVDGVVAAGKSEAYTVIARDNGPSLALYRACGFVPAETFELHAGTTSVVMQWDHADGGGPDDPVPS